MRQYAVPHFYRAGSSGWLPVNSTLAAEGGKPGWWRTRANSWSVAFGPVGANPAGTEQVTVGPRRSASRR